LLPTGRACRRGSSPQDDCGGKVDAGGRIPPVSLFTPMDWAPSPRAPIYKEGCVADRLCFPQSEGFFHRNGRVIHRGRASEGA
jgi:hypothetical protein